MSRDLITDVADMYWLDFKRFRTCVFWDTVDFPQPDPDFFNLGLFETNVVEALDREGYCSFVSIKCYGGRMDYKRSRPDKVPDDDKHRRLDKMLTDMIRWALDHPIAEDGPKKYNLLVISKDIPEEDEEDDSDFLSVLQELKKRGYNIFLVVPDDYSRPKDLLRDERCDTKGILSTAELVWRWRILCDGGYAVESDSDLEQETSEDVERLWMETVRKP